MAAGQGKDESRVVLQVSQIEPGPVENNGSKVEHHPETPGQGAGRNLSDRDAHTPNPVSGEDSNDSIPQPQPETSLPQMQAQSHQSTTTDLSEDERHYTIDADHINEPMQQSVISLPETHEQTNQSTTTDLSDGEWNYTTGRRIQSPTTSYETDQAYSSRHSPNINYIRKYKNYKSTMYYDSSGYQPAFETTSASDINPNSVPVLLSNHNCIAFDIYSVQETGKEQFPEERVTVNNNLSENITITYSK